MGYYNFGTCLYALSPIVQCVYATFFVISCDFDGQPKNLHVNITDFDDLKFENYAEGILKGSKKNQGKRWTMDRDKCT